ncbi:hypothetical protein ANCDUO_20693, partial [Ancylostoma duodenale]
TSIRFRNVTVAALVVCKNPATNFKVETTGGARKCQSMTRSRIESTSGRKPSLPAFPTPRLRLLSLVEMDEAMKRKSRTDNLDLFRKISGCIQIIAANFHNRQMENKITDEWRLMSLVIDRVCLVLYIVMNLIGNVLFIYNSPTLYDDRPSLGKT